MNGPPHCNNLLSPYCVQFGVEYVHDKNSACGGSFVVVFARPG
jgi:uncharacterized protein YkwD